MTMALRGFALMSPEKRRELAAKGGIAAHVKGRGHEFTSEEAKAAGRKGGLEVQRRKAARAAAKAFEEKTTPAQVASGIHLNNG
jgi:general stress protein YciG